MTCVQELVYNAKAGKGTSRIGQSPHSSNSVLNRLHGCKQNTWVSGYESRIIEVGSKTFVDTVAKGKQLHPRERKGAENSPKEQRNLTSNAFAMTTLKSQSRRSKHRQRRRSARSLRARTTSMSEQVFDHVRCGYFEEVDTGGATLARAWTRPMVK